MKIINLFLFFSLFIGSSNPLDKHTTIFNQAPECTVTVSVTDITCTINGTTSNDGIIKVVADATSGKTAIKWSSTTTSILIPDSWEQTNLEPGEYTIEVFNNDTSVYKKTHLVKAPDNLEISIKETHNPCYDGKEGSISITATGGTPPYKYSINNGESFSDYALFEELKAGEYIVTVQDKNNCSVSRVVKITQGRYFSIHHPESIEIAACSSQQEIDEAFSTWLGGFKYYGGTTPFKEKLDHDPIPGPCGGSILVTYTVVDNCGVEKTCAATFTVLKKEALEITTKAQAMQVSCENDPKAAFQQWLTNNGNAIANSTCEVIWTNNYTEELWDHTCENSKSIAVTFTASNGCESLETTATFSIEDTTAPELSDLPEDLTLACDKIPVAATLTAVDNCDNDVSVQLEEKTTTDGCSRIIERTWRATDCAGNTTSHTQTITIEDNKEPSFVETLPVDLTVSCQAVPKAATLTAVDNCDNDVSVQLEEKTTTDGCSSIIERTWRATDCAGNTTSYTQTITIEDNKEPSFVETLPVDLTVSCQAVPKAATLTAVDNCDNDVSVQLEEKTTTDGCSSIIERTWRATDCAGNTTSHTQTITIEDNKAPVLAPSSVGYPQNINVSCGEIPAAPVLHFEDNCSQELKVAYRENNGTINQDGSYLITRIWRVSDSCSNIAEFTQQIKVTPNNELKFNQEPGDLTIQCGNIPEPANITATNGCQIQIPVAFTQTLIETDCTPFIERRWEATDNYGNSISHTQIIRVEDNQAPVFVEALPEDKTLYCSTLPAPETLTAVDQCDGDLVAEMEETTLTQGCSQITTRTWSVSDCAGNLTSHTQTITLIVDQEAPILTAASLEIFEEEITTSCANIPEAPQLEFQDQCSEDLSVTFEETSTYVNDQTNYEIHRLWQVTDPCENQATFTQIVKVNQHNTQQDLVEIMLCQRDAAYDLNDLLPPASNFGGKWTLANDHDYLSGNFFDPSKAALGQYTAYYTLEDSCTPESIITITVHNDCVVLPCDSSQSISISKAITPNGDQYNEYFLVSGLEDCGFKLELQIFNRWGHKIYESMDYQNNWNAFSNTSNSQFMPAGTYYYILNVVDSGYDPIKGYVYVGTTAK